MKRFIKKVRSIEIVQADLEKNNLLKSVQMAEGIYTANDRYKMKKFDSKEDDLLKELEDAKKLVENRKILLERKSLLSQRAMVR
jgi:hypothetical protein